MAIAFSCPQCGKEYKVKDELAGKPVTCKVCTAPIRVPAASPAPKPSVPEVESLAAEALVEPAPAQVAAPPDEIEFECPNCIEKVKLNAQFAGKQAPCPSCKRVIRVPQISDPKARSWRAADHKPTLAKRADDPSLAGAWGNVASTSVVSRDALAEADALRKRRVKPSVISKTMWTVIGVLAASAIILGVLLFRVHRTTAHRDDFMQQALAVGDEKNAAPIVAAEVRRAAAEYRFHETPPSYIDANKLLIEASSRLSAREKLSPEKGLERLLLLTEIVLTQAQLGGDAPARTPEDKIEWDKLQTDLRRAMSALKSGDPPPEGDGLVLTFERLARTIGMSGGKTPAILGLLGSNVFPGPEERIEPLAAVALEFATLGDAGRAKSEDLAAQARGLLGEGTPQNKMIALHVLLGKLAQLPQVHAPGDGEPAANIRLGFAEGHARRGEIDRARAIARMPGRAEDRFAALVLIAAAVDPSAANPELEASVEFLEKEFEGRDLPDWPLIRLSQTIGRARASAAGARLFDFLEKRGKLAERPEALRAWAQFELLRSQTAPLSEEIVQAMTPPHAAGSVLAWEALGRQRGASGAAPDTVAQCPETIRSRPLALAGIALGLSDRLNQ